MLDGSNGLRTRLVGAKRSYCAYLPRLLLLLLHQLALELLLHPLGLRPRSCCGCEKRGGMTSACGAYVQVAG